MEPPWVRANDFLCHLLFKQLHFSGELAARFKEEGVAAYVDLVQNKERELGLDILTHQKWFALIHPLKLNIPLINFPIF